MWFYAFALLVIVASFAESQILSLALNIGQLVLYWLLIKWFVMNLSSNGQPLGLRFSGSFWGFLGYSLLGSHCPIDHHWLGVGLRGAIALDVPSY